MTSVAPYLVRAYHQWMEDSQLTPHILVNCAHSNIVVPKQHIQQDRLVLNISYSATDSLVIGNDNIVFKARFSGKSQEITVPIDAVLSIYTGENGEGMFFGNDNELEPDDNTKGKPNLTQLD